MTREGSIDFDDLNAVLRVTTCGDDVVLNQMGDGLCASFAVEDPTATEDLNDVVVRLLLIATGCNFDGLSVCNAKLEAWRAWGRRAKDVDTVIS